MSSRRSLKKKVNESIILLYTECVFYKAFVVDAKRGEADNLITELNDAHNDLLNKIAGGKNIAKEKRKKYYKDLKKDLRQTINMIGNKIGKL
ncbi:MAG: hypothetical protein ACK5MK_09550 [Dysgonomonas sp.]